MIRKLLERYYCGQAYWDYRALSIGFESLSDDVDELTVDLIIAQLDDLWYYKMSWLERRLTDAFFRERYKDNALLQE